MELKEKLEQQEKKIENQKKLLEKFPGIKEHSDRWGTIRLISKEINTIADEVFINHNCGCCPDSPIQAWPYKEFFGIEVFSDPTQFFIGQQNQFGIGEIPDSDWEEELRKENISEEVIRKIQQYFDENPERNWTLKD